MASEKSFAAEGTARAKALGLVSFAQRIVWKWVGMGQQSKDKCM